MSMNPPFNVIPSASGYRSKYINGLAGNAQMMQIIGGDLDAQVGQNGTLLTLKAVSQISSRFKLFCGYANGEKSNCVSFGTAYKNGTTMPLANGKNVVDHNLDGTMKPRGKGWSTTQDLPSGGWLDWKIAEHAGAWFMVAQPGSGGSPTEQLYTLIPSDRTPTPTAENVTEIVTLGRFYSDCSGNVRITQYVDGDVWIGGAGGSIDYHFKVTTGTDSDGNAEIYIAQGSAFLINNFIAEEIDPLDVVAPVSALAGGGWKVTSPVSGKICIKYEEKPTCSGDGSSCSSECSSSDCSSGCSSDCSGTEYHWVIKIGTSIEECAVAIANIKVGADGKSATVDQCTLGDIYIPGDANRYTLSPLMLGECEGYLYQQLGAYVYIGSSERVWDFIPARDAGGNDLPPVAQYPLTAYPLLSKKKNECSGSTDEDAIAVAEVKLPFFGEGWEGGEQCKKQWLLDPDWQDWLLRRKLASVANAVEYTSPYAETELGAITQEKANMSYFSDVEPVVEGKTPIIYTTVEEANEQSTYE